MLQILHVCQTYWRFRNSKNIYFLISFLKMTEYLNGCHERHRGAFVTFRL